MDLFTRHDKRRFHVPVIYSHLSCALSYSAYYLPKSVSYYYLKQLGRIMQNNNNNISFGKLAEGQWIKEKAQKWCSVGIDFFPWLPRLARQLHLVYSGTKDVRRIGSEFYWLCYTSRSSKFLPKSDEVELKISKLSEIQMNNLGFTFEYFG